MQNTLYCKVLNCPYNLNNVCLSEFIFIDPNGMCSFIWKDGQNRPNWNHPSRVNIRSHVNIYDTFTAPSDEENEDIK